MKISGLGLIVSAMLVGMVVSTTAPSGVRAAETHEYEIAPNDGYGLEDCLAAGAECGHVVADAWCEAHGHGHALAFGLRSAVEDSPTRVSATDEPYVIKCGD